MTALKNQDKKRWISLAVAFVATALYTVLVAQRGARFETNDDSSIVRILTQGDNSYAPFFGRILSFFLHKLYVWIPALNHWTVLTYFFVFLGLFALVYAVLVRYHWLEASLTALLLMFATWYTCLNVLNFTRTAIIVAIGGMALVANSVFLQTKIYKTEFGFGVALLLLGAQIRYQCALIAVAFLGLISLVHFLRDSFRFEKAWFVSHMRTMLTLILVALAVMLSAPLNNLLLTKEQRAYEHYNAMRAQIEDYPGNYDYSNWDAHAAEIGISKEDLRAFAGWISEDTEVFDIETIEKAVSMRENGGKLSTVTVMAKHNIRLVLFLAVFCLAKVLRKPKKQGIAFLCSAGLAIVMLMYLAYSGRLPDRVFASVVLCSVAAFTMLDSGCELRLESLQEISAKGLLQLLSSALLFACVLGAVGYVKAEVKEVEIIGPQPGKGDVYAAVVRSIGYDRINEDAENIYLMPVQSSFNTVCFACGPWEAVERDYCSNLFFLGGWDARMPHKIEALASHGIENPMRALFEKDNIYSVYDGTVLSHLRRHYDPCMTASGVSGKERLLDRIVVRYSRPVASEGLPYANVGAYIEELCFESVDSAEAWYLSGSMSELPANVKAVYFNVIMDRKEYSYRLEPDGAEFQTYLYNIPEDFDLENADICFVLELADGTYQKANICKE